MMEEEEATNMDSPMENDSYPDEDNSRCLFQLLGDWERNAIL